MSLLEIDRETESLATEIRCSYDGQTREQRRITAEQVLYFVEIVNPRLITEETYKLFEIKHPNITLGVE